MPIVHCPGHLSVLQFWIIPTFPTASNSLQLCSPCLNFSIRMECCRIFPNISNMMKCCPPNLFYSQTVWNYAYSVHPFLYSLKLYMPCYSAFPIISPTAWYAHCAHLFLLCRMLPTPSYFFYEYLIPPTVILIKYCTDKQHHVHLCFSRHNYNFTIYWQYLCHNCEYI